MRYYELIILSIIIILIILSIMRICFHSICVWQRRRILARCGRRPPAESGAQREQTPGLLARRSTITHLSRPRGTRPRAWGPGRRGWRPGRATTRIVAPDLALDEHFNPYYYRPESLLHYDVSFRESQHYGDIDLVVMRLLLAQGRVWTQVSWVSSRRS